MAVREKAGFFDVSHMSELVFHGEDALANIQHLVTTDISKMQDAAGATACSATTKAAL